MDWMSIWGWARGIVSDLSNIAILVMAFKIYKSVDEVEGLLKKIGQKDSSTKT